MKNVVNIGTRGSKLALWQAEHIKDLLSAEFPTTEFTIIVIKTTGDKLSAENPMGTQSENKNVFVKELEDALIASEIDIAVHSLKDMSSSVQEDLKLAAFIGGASRLDVLVTKKGVSFDELNDGARIGTSSPRRHSQIKLLKESADIVCIRGNLDTRLRKVDDGEYDAIILAAAGLERLGLSNRVGATFTKNEIVPSAGQGIIALEVRNGDTEIIGLARKINEHEAEQAALLEFSFMKLLGADCTVPLGVYAEIKDEKVEVNVFLSSEDFTKYIRLNREYELHNIEKVPEILVRELKTLWKESTGNNLNLR